MAELEKKTIETASGEKVEVYDAVQVEEALSENKQGLETATEERTKIEGELKVATEALAKVDEKSADFKTLREKKEELEGTLKEKEEAIVNVTKEKDDLTVLLGSTEQKFRKESYLKGLVGDDKDLKEKIDYHLQKTVAGMSEGTVEELEAKLSAAYTLATGITDTDKLSSVISSAGGNGPAAGDSKVSDELKQAGKAFGLDDKDFKAAEDANLI